MQERGEGGLPYTENEGVGLVLAQKKVNSMLKSIRLIYGRLGDKMPQSGKSYTCISC